MQQGKLEELFELLSDYLEGKDRELENDILMQSASFNRNHRDYSNGLISRDDYNLAISRVNYAITQILKKFPAEGGSKAGGVNSNMRTILFLSANPKDSEQLRLGEELRKIKDSLAMTIGRDHFDLQIEPAVQINTITGAMQKQKPEIVHFAGHGTGADGILVENEAGESVPFPTNGLDLLFKRFKNIVQCVVLNACHSKAQARAISKHGIYVIGMNKAVEDKSALDFARGFYQSIGEGNDFEFAFDMAIVNNSANLNDANTPELWLNGEKINANLDSNTTGPWKNL